MDADTVNLLTSWGLDHLIEHFQREKININTIKLLDDVLITRLIPEIGHQATFKANLRAYLSDLQKGQDLLNSSGSNTDSYQLQYIPIQQALDGFSFGTPFDQTSSRDHSLTEFLSQTPSLPSSLPEGTPSTSQLSISHTIPKSTSTPPDVPVFPDTVKNIPAHYVSKILNASVEGRDLLKRYNPTKPLPDSDKRKRILKESNVITKRRRSTPSAKSSTSGCSLPEDEEDSIFVAANEGFGSSEDIHWLRSGTTPWEVVVKKWADTSELRTSTLQSATSQVDLNQYLNLFPVLKLPLGYELLFLDFDQLLYLLSVCNVNSMPTS
ncbi:hypothetical protein M8J77_003063 [Diaphorina citri]|nr:hypothetical protein M8J77_003063 [Diaphorina citri]